MATGQLQYILARGRAYRCIPCGNVENKSRTEVHFNSQHVVDSDIPYLCVPCDFTTGDKKKLETHVESPVHLEVESWLDRLEIINSATPRYIEIGKRHCEAFKRGFRKTLDKGRRHRRGKG